LHIYVCELFYLNKRSYADRFFRDWGSYILVTRFFRKASHELRQSGEAVFFLFYLLQNYLNTVILWNKQHRLEITNSESILTYILCSHNLHKNNQNQGTSIHHPRPTDTMRHPNPFIQPSKNQKQRTVRWVKSKRRHEHRQLRRQWPRRRRLRSCRRASQGLQLCWWCREEEAAGLGFLFFWENKGKWSGFSFSFYTSTVVNPRSMSHVSFGPVLCCVHSHH